MYKTLHKHRKELLRGTYFCKRKLGKIVTGQFLFPHWFQVVHGVIFAASFCSALFPKKLQRSQVDQITMGYLRAGIGFRSRLCSPTILLK